MKNPDVYHACSDSRIIALSVDLTGLALHDEMSWHGILWDVSFTFWDELYSGLDDVRISPHCATAVHSVKQHLYLLVLLQMDIFSPCATAGVVTDEVANRLKCKAIVGAANVPFHTRTARDTTQKRGIAFVPEYITSAGAIIVDSMEWRHEDWASLRPSVAYAFCYDMVYAKVRNRGEHVKMLMRQSVVWLLLELGSLCSLTWIRDHLLVTALCCQWGPATCHDDDRTVLVSCCISRTQMFVNQFLSACIPSSLLCTRPPTFRSEVSFGKLRSVLQLQDIANWPLDGW